LAPFAFSLDKSPHLAWIAQLAAGEPAGQFAGGFVNSPSLAGFQQQRLGRHFGRGSV